jgi:hypothetical protein
MAAVDQDLRAHLEEVRAHRAEMVGAVAAVDAALERPIAVDLWRERVLAAMAELAHDFRGHRHLTEGESGWYTGVVDTAPHLQGAVDRLKEEHEQVSAHVADLLRRLEAPGPPVAELPDLREEVTALMGRLVRHRHADADLLHAAYAWDIGGSG